VWKPHTPPKRHGSAARVRTTDDSDATGLGGPLHRIRASYSHGAPMLSIVKVLPLIVADGKVGEGAPCQLKRSSYKRDDSEKNVKNVGTLFTAIRPSTGEHQCPQAGWTLRQTPSPDRRTDRPALHG
jgi:hypothetical protein